MEEEKVASDVSEKRKVEDDNINPKPNPKRIKLVRPVFSPVAKPPISTTSEVDKSEVQPIDIPKSNIQSTEVSKSISQSIEIPKTTVQQTEISKSTSESIEIPKTIVQQTEISKSTSESIEIPKTIVQQIEISKSTSQLIEIPNTTVQQTEILKLNNYSGSKIPTEVEALQCTEKSVDQLEIIKTPIVASEAVKKPAVMIHSPEEQIDPNSDALYIKNMFSEETKKELEHLKKNIFKVDDDGSSSENDSQPKRPRLKRPTFVTSTVEVKNEPTDSKMFNKINETSKFDSVKSDCEDNINKNMEKLSTAEEKIDQATKHVYEDVRLKQLGQVKIYVKDILKTQSNIISNINRAEEKKSTALNSAVKLVENKTEINKSIEVDNVYDDNTKPIQVETIVKEFTDIKEMKNVLVEEKSFDKKVNLIIEEQKCIEKEKLTEENNLSKVTYENVSDFNVVKECVNDNCRVVLERYVDKQCKAQDKTPSPIIEKLKDEECTVETSYECTDEYDKSNNEINIACNINDKIKDAFFDSELDNSQKADDITYLENIKQKSPKNTHVEDDNKLTTIMLSNEVLGNDIKQNNEEKDSQMFKSDILKAALMSKKSPESLENSLEGCDQPSASGYLPVLETKQNENLPKIGQDSIVNKIEAEIKLAINDQPTKIKKSQNKIFSNVTEMSKEACSSVCVVENTTVGKLDEPPKWGSAKMNEVEKFLNDSNVTITPICKSQESPKLGKITLKLPKVGNPEIKSETTVRPDVKSELIKKITNKHIAMGDSPLKNALSQPSKSFSDFATIRPAPKLSAEQIALLEQQILNTPKKRGRPPKALAQQKQLLLEYQQQQQSKVQEGSTENEPVFHVPLFDMEDMSGGAGMFDSFEASTPKRGKGIRGKGSRGRRGRGGRGGRGRDGSDSDTTSNSRRIDDEGENFHEEMNQEEETKQVAMIEAERLRKEEERERKLEARKKKIKLRNDILKEKKLKKKQRAEERRLQWHEKKRLMQEEKARAAEMKKSLPPPQNFDDETRMSADCNNSLSQSARNFIMGDEDLSISGTNDSIRMKKGRMEVIDLESNKTLTVDQIAEYQWPLEGGELYMIQEQISNFLGVKSFKRKYPGLKRRNVEAEERTFLCDSGLVAESLCDLGLTVLYSSEVLDIMYTDFPEKYEELREYMRLKHAKELSNRQRALMTISSNNDGSKLDLRDRAMEAVANWNANLNKSRLESRKCSMDMQTFIVHYPKNKCKKMAVPKPKIGSYPLALLPGQFCDYYATYSSEDLRYLPMNTVMYGPLKSVDKDFPVSLSSQSESEDSSSDDSSDSDDSIDVDNKSDKNCLEYGPSDKKGAECKLCLGTADKNKIGSVEPLIHCFKCLTIYHPTCLDMTLEMIPYIKRYNWQCNECKSCAQCKEVADEDKMLFCDLCDRGYHIYCVGLRRVPEGRWHCQECAMCSSCGVSDPGPGDSKWFYEFKKTEKTGSKVYCRTLCAPCSRSWKKGHFCPNCMRCYPIKNVERMTQCNSCDRYLHSECISESTSINQVVTCTICEEKAVSRLLTTVPRSLIKV